MKEQLKLIRYMILDVDGTLTDGSIYYGCNGMEIKKFSVKDGAGIVAALASGIEIMIVTGRKSDMVSRRLGELGVCHIYQSVKNKKQFIENFIQENELKKENIAYMGDDLNDYSSMKLVGWVACPMDACEEVKEIAHYVSRYSGGNGAVRDVITYILKQREEWDEVVARMYNVGI